MAKKGSSSKSSSSSGSSGKSSGRGRKPAPREPLIRLTPDQQLDLLGGALLLLAVVTILSLVSAQQGTLTELWLGVLAGLFGWGRYVVPLFIGGVGLWLILRRFGDRIPWPDLEQVVGVLGGFFVSLVTLHLVMHWLRPAQDLYSLAKEGVGGGYLGALLLDAGLKTLGMTGMVVILILAWIVVVTFTASISPAEAVEWLLQRRSAPAVPDVMPGAEPPLPAPVPPPVVLGAPTPPAARKSRAKAADEPKINLPPRNGNGETLAITPAPVGSQTWRLPVVADVLEQGSEQDFSQDLLRKQSRTIEETLASLGAPVKVKEINRGPTVTQFGVEPLFITTRGDKTTKVKVSKIVSLADDLALALSAQRIRVEAPIPGKGLVGIEVPNMEPAVVALRDVMESEGFGRLKGTLRLALGQDVSGQAVSADLRSMPHLLIAGTTGSGKSVCINAVIAALLLQNSPDTLRLLMVDPKRVELTQYGGIPHLLAPVIVDVERVVPALRWVMREMDSRYRRFADIGARNIDDFNRRVVRAGEQAIPYIVVVVDELADMMMQAPEETERVICRLAQMARATGIHLIIATQRPSVDVVTGLIKANFPARIAFAVASSVDSRVILDSPGAERLLGRGDMLFVPPDAAQPLRLQGTFVSDDELGKLIQHWRNAVEPGKAVEPTLSMPPLVAAPEPGLAPVQPALFPELEEPPAGQQFEDPLLPTAVEVLLAENRASVSLLQRRMRIGYTRAARLMDLLSDMGMVTATAEEGQFRGVNRSVAEAFLRSLYQGGENGE